MQEEKTSNDRTESEVTLETVVRRFTVEEIKAILCEGCKLKLGSLRVCDEQKWYHTINGQKIECKANDFRNNINA